MSLVGSLEDLGLGDILQIIHLSGKSGVLVLRSESDEAQIVFDRGLIRAAFRKDGPSTLDELLVAREAAAADAIAGAAEDARNRGCPLVRVLGERGLVDAETIDQIQRDHIEAALIDMFSWPAGEFSFEVRDVQGDQDEFYATPGVNPQFIALEGARMADEGAFAPPDPAEDFATDEVPEVTPADEPLAGAHIVAEAVAEAEAPADAELAVTSLSETDLLAPYGESPELEATVALEDETASVEEGLLEAEAIEAEPEQEQEAPEAPVIAEPAMPETAEPELPVPTGPPPPVVLVDPNLAVLEWAKEALLEAFPHVHIFQRTDLAIARIRQYLARTQVPLVVLSSDVPKDPISGAEGPYEILRRLRRQSAQMAIAILAPAESEITAPTDAHPAAVVRKPEPAELADPRREEERLRIGNDLVEELLALGRSGARRPAVVASEPDSDAIERLRETSARIRDGAAHGEVLPQVLEFAAQIFGRVALFMVRDDRALGIAQIGLHRAGGPDEVALREIHLDAREPAWFRTVLDTRAPHRGAPSDEGDQRLAVLLGNEIPAEAYVAPIQTADHIVAIVYGDNLPNRAPIGETAALEVLIDSAGIALERTLLERELAATEH